MAVSTYQASMFRHAEIVRNKLAYFEVFDTPEGRIQIEIQKDPTKTKSPDTTATATIFDRDHLENYSGGFWHFVASLGYEEIESRNLSLGAMTDAKLEILSLDAECLLFRALMVLNPEYCTGSGRAS